MQKPMIRLEAIFESNLVASRSLEFKGYQQTFPAFLHALRDKNSKSDNNAGKIEVNIDIPVVGQLWEKVTGVLEITRHVMVPFLRIFGAVEGHGFRILQLKCVDGCVLVRIALILVLWWARC